MQTRFGERGFFLRRFNHVPLRFGADNSLWCLHSASPVVCSPYAYHGVIVCPRRMFPALRKPDLSPNRVGMDVTPFI